MPIRKDGDGKILYEEKRDRWDSDVTGVYAEDDFAVADNIDPTKQIKFNPSSQTTNTTVVIESGGNTTDIVLTLPSTSGSLGGGGGVNSFTTIQPDLGTSPVATSGADTLTLTSSDNSILITGDRTTDTIDLVAVGGGGGITELTGDITAGPGSGSQAATIANDAVTNTKLANMATASFKGRTTAGTGDPEDLTATQATALLNVFTSSDKGLAPASGGGTTNFLRADGTWAAPPSGGGGLTEAQILARVAIGV